MDRGLVVEAWPAGNPEFQQITFLLYVAIPEHPLAGWRDRVQSVSLVWLASFLDVLPSVMFNRPFVTLQSQTT